MNNQQHRILQERIERHSCCVLIPVSNNAYEIQPLIEKVLTNYTDHLLVVSNNLTGKTKSVLSEYEKSANFHHISLNKRKGKGSLFKVGFQFARECGYRNVITIDPEEPEHVENIPAFVEKMDEAPGTMIIGERHGLTDHQEESSSFSHKFSKFWFSVETGHKLNDVNSSYRLYPIDAIENLRLYSTGKEFEMEALVKSVWKGLTVVNMPMSGRPTALTKQAGDYKSVKDVLRFSILCLFLLPFAIMWHRPRLMLRDLKQKRPRDFINEYVLHSNESNTRLALSVGLGISIGVAPIWGYQLATLLLLAYLLRLNKVIAFVAANLILPPLIPIVIYVSFLLGGYILPEANPAIDFSMQISFNVLKEQLLQYVVGALCLVVIMFTLFTPLSYLLLLGFRKKYSSKI